ncbi:hypothetical protein J6590_062499 [Homalodisca vitripennis]|nr:hypothetical protein J6590_062499 [Homalodisca vitripennis]
MTGRKGKLHTTLYWKKMKEVEPLAKKDCVIKKINNMRSSFRKEVKKIKESMKTGSGAYEVYKPKLWYFESLRFLNDQETPRQSISNIDNHDSENEDENQATADNTEHSNDSFHTDDVQSPTPQDDTSHGRRFSASRPRPTLLKRMTPTQQATLTGELLQTVNEHFKHPRPSEDRHDIFGKNVANVLREVLVPQRILAEKFINDVLFHAQMGTLTSSHGFTKVPRFPQHHEVPLPVQSASTNSTTFFDNNSYCGYNQMGMPLQSPGPSGYHLNQSASAPNQLSPNNDSLGGRKTKKPPFYQQLTQLTRTPTELSPHNDADEGITASRFVSSYLPDDEQ